MGLGYTLTMGLCSVCTPVSTYEEVYEVFKFNRICTSIYKLFVGALMNLQRNLYWVLSKRLNKALDSFCGFQLSDKLSVVDLALPPQGHCLLSQVGWSTALMTM